MAGNTSPFLIDPYLLARPAQLDWELSIESVVAWAAEVRARRNGTISTMCLTRLMESGEYPYLNAADLHTQLVSAGITHVAGRDLCTLVNALLDRAMYLESTCNAVLCDEFSATPDAPFRRQVGAVGESLADAVVAYYLVGCQQFSIGAPISLASRPGDSLGHEADFVVEATVLDAAFNEPSAPGLLGPVKFNARLRFYPEVPDWNPLALMGNPRETVLREYEARLSPAERELRPVRPFTFGESFLSSISELGLSSDREVLGVIIKQIARIVSGQESRWPSMDIHPWREGRGAGERQVVRGDGFAAFRVTVTKRGAGYRLMYWRRANSYEIWEVRKESE